MKQEKKEPLNAEIVSEETRELAKAEVVPKFEITVSEAKNRLDELNSFIKSQMVDKQDFGKVPGFGSKPTLFKSGAEKLENIHGFYHEFEQLEKIEDFDKEFFFYRYKCKVFHKKSGFKQAECVGSANSKESNRKGQNVYNLINTIDKMAQKRAFVGAILSACRVSSTFTQDLEDIKTEAHQTASKPSNRGYKCIGCQAPISVKVAEYSSGKYGEQLCMDCQNKRG